MTDTPTRRRGHGEDAIYFDAAKNRYVGAISVGFGPGGKRVRRKVTGRTKAEVRDKLKAAHAELDRGLHTSATYTVRQAVDDWLAAEALWQDRGLVFASAIGTPLDAANVRREFRKITEAARLGVGWAPRDLRHTFVSLMSADGVPIEEIARLAGHNRTATTELVYRHELRPVITTGAEVMDRILSMSRGH
jgi:hypothetical protein